MNALIVTLLDLSALESGAAVLDLTRFDFVELVETAAGRLLVDGPDTGGGWNRSWKISSSTPEKM